MTREDSIHASRVRVLREAEQTGNVSATQNAFCACVKARSSEDCP